MLSSTILNRFKELRWWKYARVLPVLLVVLSWFQGHLVGLAIGIFVFVLKALLDESSGKARMSAGGWLPLPPSHQQPLSSPPLSPEPIIQVSTPQGTTGTVSEILLNIPSDDTELDGGSGVSARTMSPARYSKVYAQSVIRHTVLENVLSRVLLATLFFASLLLLIRFVTLLTSRTWTDIPSSCPKSYISCCHLSADYTSGSPDLLPLKIQATSDDVGAAIHAWVDDLQFASVKTEAPSFMHVAILSPFFGFPSDFAVSWTCNPKTQAVDIAIHSRSQLPLGDFGGNHARVAEFTEYMKARPFAAGPCR